MYEIELKLKTWSFVIGKNKILKEKMFIAFFEGTQQVFKIFSLL
jgi:hypothetical protein